MWGSLLLLGESHLGLVPDMKTIFEANLSPLYIYYVNHVFVGIAKTYVQSVCRFQVLGGFLPLTELDKQRGDQAIVNRFC